MDQFLYQNTNFEITSPKGAHRPVKPLSNVVKMKGFAKIAVENFQNILICIYSGLEYRFSANLNVVGLIVSALVLGPQRHHIYFVFIAIQVNIINTYRQIFLNHFFGLR